MPWYEVVEPDGKHNAFYLDVQNGTPEEEKLTFDTFIENFREHGMPLTEISEELAEYITFYRDLLEYGDSQAALERARKLIACPVRPSSVLGA